MSLFRSSFVVGFFTLLSRGVGYFRDMLLAKVLGAGAMSDAFFVAFRLPNLFRALFAEGALNAAFVPMAAKFGNKDDAAKFTSQVYSILFIALLLITVIAQVFMPALVWLLASGFSVDSPKFELSVELSRITFGYLLFISLTALLGAVLNSMNRFVAAASAPLFLNLTIIFFLMFLVGTNKTPAHTASWGVFASGIVQFLWLYFACKKTGLKIKLQKPVISEDIKTLFKKMFPVIIGAGVLQINLLINTQIASYISDGAISYLYYADRIAQLPLAVIGTAIGTALLPMLAKQIKSGDKPAVQETQNKAFEMAWFIGIPCGLGIAAVSYPLVVMLFERGQFNAADSAAVTNALIAYSLGIPATILTKIFMPPYYANGDTKTPMQIAVASIFVNFLVSLTLVYVFNFDHVALAIATSLSSWVNVGLLILILHRRGIYSINADLIKWANLVAVCGLGMAAFAYFSYLVTATYLPSFIALAFVISSAAALYFILAHALKLMDLKIVFSVINKKLKKK